MKEHEDLRDRFLERCKGALYCTIILFGLMMLYLLITFNF